MPAALCWIGLGCVLSSAVFACARLCWVGLCFCLALLGFVLGWAPLGSVVLGSALLLLGSAELASCSFWLGSQVVASVMVSYVF